MPFIRGQFPIFYQIGNCRHPLPNTHSYRAARAPTGGVTSGGIGQT